MTSPTDLTTRLAPGTPAGDEARHGPVPHVDAALTLSDGRSLGYAVYGDPAGRPLFYFHGHPGSRLEAALWHEAAARQGVSIIGTDRPGMGISDRRAGRVLLDWPGDVAALADHLHLDRFAVLGISGGGPYAVACAHELPDRVACCLLVASATPAGLDVDDGEHDALAANRLQARLVRFAPWALDLAFAAMGRSIRRQAARRGYRAVTEASLSALPPIDRAALGDPDRAVRYGRSLTEAVRQGGRGPGWDARLLARPWGFEPSDVRVENMHLWHGGLDRNVPLSAGRALAAALPAVETHFRPGEGHLSVAVNHLDEIMAAVVA